MALGDGFSKALEQAANGGLNPSGLFGVFGKLFDQLGEDLYRRLRDDVIAEVRAEVQRAEATENRLAEALAKVAPPVVHVTPTAPQVLAGDIEVNVPKAPAPKVTVQPPKHIEIRRNGEGQITGADVS